MFTAVLKHRKIFTWNSSTEVTAAEVILHLDPICKSEVTCEVYWFRAMPVASEL